MARPRAHNHDDNRALIRDRAAAAFARLGYASASMADLAQACDVSKASLYHYYDSKAVSYTHLTLPTILRVEHVADEG